MKRPQKVGKTGGNKCAFMCLLISDGSLSGKVKKRREEGEEPVMKDAANPHIDEIRTSL